MFSAGASWGWVAADVPALLLLLAAATHHNINERRPVLMTAVPNTAKRPTDRAAKKPTSAQRAEALDTPVTFTFDGDDFTVTPSDATSLEFLEALEDEQVIKALRMLLGPEQASRLIKGRQIEDLEGFFETMGEAVDAGNH